MRLDVFPASGRPYQSSLKKPLRSSFGVLVTLRPRQCRSDGFSLCSSTISDRMSLQRAYSAIRTNRSAVGFPIADVVYSDYPASQSAVGGADRSAVGFPIAQVVYSD